MAARNLPTTKPSRKASEPAAEAIVLQRPVYERFDFWVVGDSPLITHAWSEKARRDMYDKQIKKIKAAGREARDPHQDFIDSLYDFGNGIYGFPVSAFKKAMQTSAHVNRGIPKVSVFPSVNFDYTIVSVRPALAGARCNMPLIRIVGEPPAMREDMGRVGTGLNRKATLLYRGEFWPWAIHLTGRVNTAAISMSALTNLLLWSGTEVGIGEWRTEKSGVMGAYHPADEDEAKAWARFAAGKGSIPVPENTRTEAA